MMLWVLDVPAATPSLNAFANRRHVWIYPRLRAQWQQYLCDAWYDARAHSRALAGFTPPARARLTITRYSPHAIDPDNLIGGVKPVIDALRRLSLLGDDDPACLALVVRPERASRCATVLVLEPWPEDLPDGLSAR